MGLVVGLEEGIGADLDDLAAPLVGLVVIVTGFLNNFISLTEGDKKVSGSDLKIIFGETTNNLCGDNLLPWGLK